MNCQRKIAIGVVIVFALALATAAMLQPRTIALFPEGSSVTEEQFRQKLEAIGYTGVKIERDGNYLKALAAKDGRQQSIAVDRGNGQNVDVVVNDVD